MVSYISTRGAQYAVLGIVAGILTLIGLQTLVPKSETLQNIFHISKSAGGALAYSASSCMVAKKDLKNEVFFVSCGGFF